MFKTKNRYQNDEPWKSAKLGNTNETIGGWGGLLTSITMVLNGIGYPDETPFTVNEKLKKAGGFLKALIGPPYVAYVWPNCIYRGITRCENSDAPIAKIDEAVAAGKPVILQVDSSKRMGIQTHFVLVKEKRGDDYVVYDPFRDKGDNEQKEILLTKRYRYNSAELQETSAKLAREISAVLWFDFDKAELPAPPPRTKPTKIPKEKYTVYAAEERLVLRADRSADSYPWKCLFMGTELIGLAATDQVNLGLKDQWIQVQDPNGEQGYVSASFVTSDLSTLLPPTAAQPSRKKWCLKNVSVQHPVVEMRRYRAGGTDGPVDQEHKPVKPFDTLKKNTVVNVLESNEAMAGLVNILYRETYYDSGVKDWVTVRVTGWLNEVDLDDYHEDEREKFQKSMVDIQGQTQSSTDAQQYLYIKDKDGKRTTKARYNMCGELSIAFLVGKDIDTVLAEWRDKEWEGHKESKAMYDSMVGNADQPLGPRHIENLLRLQIGPLQGKKWERYKVNEDGTPRKDYVNLADPDGDRRLASQKLEDRLEDYYFLTNLKIDTNTGDLAPSYSAKERNHWVVLDRVTRDRTRVELYNPFPNRLEEYSFGEFYRSVGGDPNSGWWIKKEVTPADARQKTSDMSVANVASAASATTAGKAAGRINVSIPLRAEEAGHPTFEVAIDNRTAYEKDAEQYLYIRGEGSRPKTKLCGEFSVAFILGQSLDTSLKHWMETQSKGAGLRELATVLQAYGFNRRKYIKPPQGGKTEPGKYYVAPNNQQGLPSDPQEYFKSFSIDTVLEYWKGVQPDLYKDLLGGNNNEPTGLDHLITILKAYGYSNKDYSLNRPGSQESFGIAPGRDAEVVGKTHFLLAGVNIHGSTGRLQPAGVAHWVVVTKLTPLENTVGGNGGWVELYNPFPNCWEEYSYREFMDSFRGSSAGSTLWIKKDVSPVFTKQIPVQSGQTGERKGQHQPGAVPDPIGDNPPMDVKRVVCKRLGVDVIPWEVEEWIRTTADEDPYFAEELAETLYECGILSIQTEKDQKTQSAVLSDPEFSDKLENAIQKNLERLSSSPRNWDPALKVAGAILPLFTTKAIQEIKRIRQKIPIHAYQKRDEFRAWTLGLASKAADPFEAEIIKKMESLSMLPADLRETITICGTALTRPTSAVFEEAIKKIYADLETMQKIRDIWGFQRKDEISLAEVREWVRGLVPQPKPKKNVYRVKRWGDPGMRELGFDVRGLEERGQSSNFQAVSLYNTATGFGAISNYLIIPPEEVLKLEALQVEDEYEDKKGDDWLHQKMNWLCKFRGTIYFFAEADTYTGRWGWRRREGIRWGTLALGGNLVQVLDTDTFEIKLPGKDKVEPTKMARLQGFQPDDWDRSLDDLLAEGLVHRCFCVYGGNGFGDSPKGIAYSPLWSPECYEFRPKTGSAPKNLWIPFDYLENPPEE